MPLDLRSSGSYDGCIGVPAHILLISNAAHFTMAISSPPLEKLITPCRRANCPRISLADLPGSGGNPWIMSGLMT
jgi:hypothetical protein